MSCLFYDVNTELNLKIIFIVRMRYLIMCLLQMISDEKQEKAPIFSDDDISRTVDFAIKIMDKNSDGFIEFPEFAVGSKEYD